MEADSYTELDDDGGKKMTYEMARHGPDYSKDGKEEHLSRTEIGS